MIDNNKSYINNFKKILNNKGKNIITNLKAGDRFVTPKNQLDSSLFFRAKYTSKGLK